MKVHQKFVAAAFVATAALTSWEVGWAGERVDPADIRQNLFSACFISENEGWVVGDLGRILYTTDGGKTFERLDAGTKRAFLSVACFPDKTLVLTGKAGIIYKSPDGGKTWSQQKSGLDRNLLSASFATKDLGLVVGDAGTILRTADGGASWQKMVMPEQIPLPEEVDGIVPTSDLLLYDVSFVSPEQAWIVGEFGIVITSSDGGLTWVAQTSGIEGTLFGVTFTDPQNGWAVGISSMMIRTHDGGATWQKVPAIPDRLGVPLSLYDVAIRGQYGWAVGDSGYVVTSTDGGGTWKLAEVPIQLAGTWFRGAGMVQGGRGVIVGADGLMMGGNGDTFTPLRKL